jgi:hypothetical protein
VKPGPHHATAVALFDGDKQGAPRYREGIIRDIEAALERASANGRKLGETETRERALRDSLAIARGLAQDATYRVNAIERELAEWIRSRGGVSDV